MEKIAENQFTITKPLFMEGMLRISQDGYGKSAQKAMLRASTAATMTICLLFMGPLLSFFAFHYSTKNLNCIENLDGS